ncbi:DUF418 domain-containing protein [Saccharibacillus alkalitolerans]|uniref:DUF418 domain-containing protein n=1 Tax=Saccharibacillus alkalitolerans TaxID=2705290 RepID=A0ABX0F5D5_9BACL|nr:DUF418 domain-containing protein [Saccharibacillus alkalitolerans]NGZ75135.1 DUF418 domain-containing protein [Saccharibacillus alkalitolerans]
MNALKPKGAGRLIALDAARGLAVIGMFIQHFALNGINGSLVSGNTTLLFILCGGISYSIMFGRMTQRENDIKPFRARMLARAVFVDLIGYLLIMLNGPFGVILPAYAGLFVLALVLIRRSTRTLFVTAGAMLLIAPPLMILGGSLFSGAFLLGDLAGGPMSALALAPTFVLGMALGRLDLTSLRSGITLAASGLFFFIAGRIMAVHVLPGWSAAFEQWLVAAADPAHAQPPDEYATWPLNTNGPLWHMLFSWAPHSASTFQTATGTGLAVLVLGLCGLIAKKAAALLSPFAAVGRVSLTLYAAQFVVVWILGLNGIESGLGEVPFGDGLVAIGVVAAGWLLTRLPGGPLETIMRRFDRLFVGSSAVSPSKKTALAEKSGTVIQGE